MGPLQPRTTSVPIATFTAIVVVLVLWILALLAIIMYLFLYWRKRATRSRRRGSFNQSVFLEHTAPHVSPSGSIALTSYPQRAQTPSYPERAPSPLLPQPAQIPSYPQRVSLEHTAPHVSSSGSIALTSYPQRAQTPSYPQRAQIPSYPQRAQILSYPPWSPSPLSETTSLPDLRPARTAFNPLRPENSTRIQDFGRITKVSPTKTTISALPSSNQARLQVPLAGTLSQAANSARLQSMSLSSDITDMSAETVDPDRQVVNPGYKAVLEQMGIRASQHALSGSDDSTDAGTPVGLSFADRARGMCPGGVSIDVERGRGLPVGHCKGGQIMMFGRDIADDGVMTVAPLYVRKMASM